MRTILILFSFMLLIGCVSTKQHARNLIRKGWKKVEQGMALDPVLADSINRVKKLAVAVPGEKKEKQVSTYFDSLGFEIDIKEFTRLSKTVDSLYMVLEALGQLPHQDKPDSTTHFKSDGIKEIPFVNKDSLAQVINSLKKNIKTGLARESELKNKFLRGYAKDSTYVLPIDSVSNLKFTVSRNKPIDIQFERKPTTLNTKVNTMEVKLDGTQRAERFYQDQWFWYWLLFLLLTILLSYLLIRK